MNLKDMVHWVRANRHELALDAAATVIGRKFVLIRIDMSLRASYELTVDVMTAKEMRTFIHDFENIKFFESSPLQLPL